MNKKTGASAPEPDLSLLMEGIRADADAKIEEIEAQAAASASAKLRKAAEKATAIEAEAAQTARARELAVKAIFEARLKTETRKLELESEERFMRRVLDQAVAEYAKAEDSPEYGDRLFAWACEAAIGISSPEAEIRASEAEAGYLNAEFLARVEHRVFELSGRSIRLSISKELPLDRQGLLLESENGRLRYDNSASARLARAEAAMRGLIRAAIEPARSNSLGRGAKQP
jgi:vacuolar-type H+-ATPase subunit E/Vma4